MSKIYTGKNQEIEAIMTEYEHFGYMTGADITAFKNYRDEIRKELQHKDFILRHNIAGITAEHYSYLEAEVENINWINKHAIYRGSVTSLHQMNGVLQRIWDMECSGYTNNPFFDFKKLVEMVNAYWKISKPYKPSNKIAYGWKFSMDKADCKYGYMSKPWKLYMWGCIKNYLIRNGVDFTKEESLKVRKIVGLVDIYSTME